MKYHIYDPQSYLYVETVESENQPANSVDGSIPEITEYYTIAFIDNQWVSVVNPKYEIIDNQFVEKNQG